MPRTTSLMLNPDGSSYHLHARPEDIAPLIILVGDPNRAHLVAQYFDELELEKGNREFILKTGRLHNQRLTVVSTGIGTDNIDIVINELDMLVNMDLITGEIKKPLTSLRIFRFGTSGAVQADIALHSLVISTYAFTFDSLLHFYKIQYTREEKSLQHALQTQFAGLPAANQLCTTRGDPNLIEKFKSLGRTGLTFTASGFYGPQGRTVRAEIVEPNMVARLCTPLSEFGLLTNIEMETAAIYGLGKLLGHQCCSISTIVANRITEEKSNCIASAIEEMIRKGLTRLVNTP